jgi:hypothetical protein
MKQAESRVGFMYGLLSDPEDRGDTFLRTVSCISPDYTASYYYYYYYYYLFTAIRFSSGAVASTFVYIAKWSTHKIIKYTENSGYKQYIE